MTWARRVDGPQAAIVQALRKVGCQVADTSRLGEGFTDLVVRVPGQGWFRVRPRLPGGARILLVEVKRPGGKLTPAQQRFIADWPEVEVVESVDDALALVGVR